MGLGAAIHPTNLCQMTDLDHKNHGDSTIEFRSRLLSCRFQYFLQQTTKMLTLPPGTCTTRGAYLAPRKLGRFMWCDVSKSGWVLLLVPANDMTRHDQFFRFRSWSGCFGTWYKTMMELCCSRGEKSSPWLSGTASSSQLAGESRRLTRLGPWGPWGSDVTKIGDVQRKSLENITKTSPKPSKWLETSVGDSSWFIPSPFTKNTTYRLDPYGMWKIPTKNHGFVKGMFSMKGRWDESPSWVMWNPRWWPKPSTSTCTKRAMHLDPQKIIGRCDGAKKNGNVL